MSLRSLRLCGVIAVLLTLSASAQKKLDPAAWGSNHTGKPIPEYVHGDECLFCHRNDIGPGWQKNAHGITVRQREDAPELVAKLKDVPADAEYFLGSRNHVRYLKKEGYGKFAILNTPQLAWDMAKFGNQCAGCHTTGVEAASKTFSAFGLDCYTCHGNVTLDHTHDTSLIWLSKKKRSDIQAVTSICASCHLRGGKSKSSGLPYANNFIAGDNLFQDFQFDFAKADDTSTNPGDRHIFQNVRDVVVNGSDSPSCLSCHRVHERSTQRHRFAVEGPVCFSCHTKGAPMKQVQHYEVHSALCEY